MAGPGVNISYGYVNAFANLQGDRSGLVSAARLSVGKYRLRFDSPVRNCPRTVTLGPDQGGAINEDLFDGVVGHAYAFNGIFNDQDLVVTTFNSAGAADDLGFSVMMICN